VKGKVLEVEERMVTIGMENGTIKEISLDNFKTSNPQKDDKVELFEGENSIHVNLVKPTISLKMDEERKNINKVAFILLALFTGGIGGHKFYQGKIGVGILYLIFCWTWIPSILAIIELIIAAFKETDVNGNFI
jgi:TM2 domain-containing membrane protein YozV